MKHFVLRAINWHAICIIHNTKKILTMKTIFEKFYDAVSNFLFEKDVKCKY